MSNGQPTGPSTSMATSSARSAASSLGDSGKRETFAPDELAIVLSHYDLGTVRKVQEFPRGSRRSPKLLVHTDRGVHLLKRRARGRDDPFKVAFCHQLQLYLMSRQFPLPHLIGTKTENNSMLQLDGRIYEVFEYINGSGYDSTLEATQDAGKTLGLFHKLVREWAPDYETPHGTYHASKAVVASLQQVPQTLARVDADHARRHADRIERVVKYLLLSYRDAANRTHRIGLDDWPAQIIHSDWHPGNMLFRKSRVVAVIDYDSARTQQRIVDAANGALQFSIIGGGDDVERWPDYIDGSRYKRFLRGYDSVDVLSRSELRTLPWLMIEALIAEAAIPVAATGSFARMEGFGFLTMIERKVRWLQKHAEKLAGVLDA